MVAYKFIQLKLGRNFPCINHMPECREKGGFPRAGKTNNHVAQFSHGNTSSVVRPLTVAVPVHATNCAPMPRHRRQMETLGSVLGLQCPRMSDREVVVQR